MQPRRATFWFPESPRHAALLAFVVSMVCGLTCTALGVSGSGFYDGYMALGDSLAHGVGYRFSAEEPLVLHRPPVYPLMLAPIAKENEKPLSSRLYSSSSS